MSDDFSNAPVSIAEHRSDKSQNCADWTPRDVLVNLLPLVVSYAEHQGDAVSTFYSCAAPNILAALGCVARTQHRMQLVGD